jgi:hypothetical protein
MSIFAQMKVEIIGERRNLNKEELHNFHCSKEDEMVGHVESRGK